jgi:hypothetical protein
MEAVYFSETLVTTGKTAWFHNPEDHELSIHCGGILRNQYTYYFEPREFITVFTQVQILYLFWTCIYHILYICVGLCKTNSLE